MNWIDKIRNTVLTVVTGDGKVWKPIYRNANNNKQEVEMNAVVIEFNDVDGAYVPRGAIGPFRFPFEFIFQGADHLDVRDDFIKSLPDRRAWAISSPHIGSKIVQPISLSINNSGENVTVISGEFYETIADINPSKKLSEKREAEIKLESSIETTITSSSELNLTTEDLAATAQTNDSLYGKVKAGAVTDLDLGNISTAIAEADAAFATAGQGATLYMRKYASVIRSPSNFFDTITNRVDILKSAYTDLEDSVTGIPSLGKKAYFEFAAAMNVVAQGEANLIPISEIAEQQGIAVDNTPIITRKQIMAAIDDLNSSYNSYLTTLGTLQSEKDNKLDSYIPDVNNIFDFESAISQVVGNLVSMSVSAKTEVSYTTTEDIPIVALVVKLLGTYDNLTIQNFAKDNDLGQNDVMIIEAGTTLSYYI